MERTPNNTDMGIIWCVGRDFPEQKESILTAMIDIPCLDVASKPRGFLPFLSKNGMLDY